MVNKRSYSFFIILCLVFIPVIAQDASQWTSHISYAADIENLEKNENTVYAVTDGKLFIYNNSDENIETFIKQEGGNTDIKHIIYSPKHKCLLITRADANIELLFEDKSYVNISDLKNSTQNIDKTINKIFIYEDLAYIATNFGFLIINLLEKNVKDFGIFNVPFYSILVDNNKLYAATQKGILYIDINDNVKDLALWKNMEVSTHYTNSENKFTDDEIRDILVFKNQFHFRVPQKAIYRMDSPTSVKMVLAGEDLNSMRHLQNNHIIVSADNAFWDYEDLDKNVKININLLTSVIPNGNRSGEYWVGSSGNNLSLIKANGNSYEYIKRWKSPQGPASNYPFSLTLQNKQLFVTGGGFYLSGANKSERMDKAASISIYKDSRWTNIYSSDISSASGVNARDLVYSVSDPTNPKHIFASSWGEGLYEFEGAKYLNRYDNTNSTIEAIVSGDYSTTRVGGMVFDKNSNLWMLNPGVKNIITVRLKSGEWKQIYYTDIANAYTNPKDIIIDKYSNKWVTSFGGDNYLFIFNDNGTINDNSDDKYIYLSGEGDRNYFMDQDKKRLNISDINTIAEDVNGHFWLGTDIGPFQVYSSSNIFTEEIIFRRIKVESGSGSNSVTGLLENVAINAIAIDGANRKWIATQTSGVYLISSDNQETLAHFTLDDSPLPSNNVMSLAIDPNNGSVYFGTERGMMSYRGSATEGADDFSNVYSYPNPIRPGYEGSVSITGLQSNSRVKITDLKGNLINEGRSLGGQYSWNLQNARGRRVDSGVYLVFGSSENGSEGVVTKIMVVN
ncbi:hypothetical protein CLV62_12120 [Dysgonomonas alginatilytica]|uniref:PorZ N-terminal beta-propeller domain-containing protein n=1 Tax=Dysgonomonas alginatilytica TaxID=1605892 RepID=A0A2V3PKX6_9BACT|nr:hypothetical protein [Dysgonomonas alginatilytica]PXV62197.1 hypothetical protein CLV62_12120 [Dysgonomonas alginatilytica]